MGSRDVGTHQANKNVGGVSMDVFQSGQYMDVTIAVFLIIAMLKIIGFLITKIAGEQSMLTRREQVQLDEIYKLVTAKDGDGMPLFYVPRSWANLQTSILDKMEKITRHQERMTYTMDTVVSAIDKILEREIKK